MFELRQILPEEQWTKVRLVLIGGCRNPEDEKRVQDLKDLCKHLSVEENVEFRINVPFSELCEAMRTAFIGLHTMWNEHFGIAVVEMLAAGLLTIGKRYYIIHSVQITKVLCYLFKFSRNFREIRSDKFKGK